MRKILVLLSFFVFSLVNAQEEKKAESPKSQVSESAPVYPGGMKAFYKYIHSSLKGEVIPSGKMIINFIIEADGSLNEIVIKQGLQPDFNKKVIVVFKNSPKWRPGYQRNKPLRVAMSMPITFDSDY